MVPLDESQWDDDIRTPRDPDAPDEPGDVIDGLEIPQSIDDTVSIEVGDTGGGESGGGDGGGGGRVVTVAATDGAVRGVLGPRTVD